MLRAGDPVPALALFACTSSMAGQFMIFGVALFMRQGGAPSTAIGMVSLVAIPYVLRFLWSPLLDRFSPGFGGHYRGWMIAAQAALVAALGLALLPDPAASPLAMIALLLPVSVALGTQAMAIDALTVRLVPQAAHTRALTWQRAGASVAGLLLGGGLIWGVGDLGWAWVVGALMAVEGLALLAMLASPLDAGRPAPVPQRRGWRAPLAVFLLPGLPLLFFAGLLTTLPVDLPYAMKSVILTDAGFSTAQVGLIGICLANGVGLLALLAARPVIERFGGYAVLAGLALVGLGLAAGFAATGAGSGWPVALYTVAAGALAFVGSVAVAQLLYARVDGEEAATQTASFWAGSSVILLLIHAGATSALDTTGLVPLLLGAGGIALAGLVLALHARRGAAA